MWAEGICGFPLPFFIRKSQAGPLAISIRAACAETMGKPPLHMTLSFFESDDLIFFDTSTYPPGDPGLLIRENEAAS